MSTFHCLIHFCLLQPVRSIDVLTILLWPPYYLSSFPGLLTEEKQLMSAEPPTSLSFHPDQQI